MFNKIKNQSLLILVVLVSILPFVLNLLGVDFSSTSINFADIRNSLSDVTADDKFNAIKGGMHHALLEWTAVSIALIAGFASFRHYYLYRDISAPIIGLALLCAGFTDAFHTLAATRIISANVPNADFIPFTWAFSRTFNASLMLIGIGISMYIRNKYFLAGNQVKFKWKDQYGFRVLLAVSTLFIGFAIASVFWAATSEELPQTTFKNALITRPFDVLPLALFFFSGALAWSWYKKSPTVIGYGLLLSLIPEIITQLHMAFGSAHLFDNHFNIAHALKVVAYICLLGGILASLIGDTSQRISQSDLNNKENQAGFRQFNSNLKRLKVGRAEYPLTLMIPCFALALSLFITVLITETYEVDTERLFKQEKLSQLSKEAIVIESLIKSIYHRTESEVEFLGNTPPVQNIIKAIQLKDKQSDDVWRSRLRTIFSSLMNSESAYEEIRFVQLVDNNRELVKSYRQHGQVYVAPKAKLAEVNDKYLLRHLADLPGHVSFYMADQNNRRNKYSELKVIIPIYDQTKDNPFGLLEIKVNLSTFINQLKLDSLLDRKFLIASEKGNVFAAHDVVDHDFSAFEVGKLLQDLIPDLGSSINQNIISFDLSNSISKLNNNVSVSDGASNTTTGHYRTMAMRPGETDSILRVFIFLDTVALDASLSEFRNRSWVIGIGLAFFALAFAVFMSRKITQPMQDIIQELQRFEFTGEVENLPVDAQDEIGVFSRSFHNLLLSQKEKEHELLQQKFSLDEHSIVSITDVKGTINYVNQKFCDISEFTEEELLGENHRILNSDYHETSFFTEMYETLIAGNSWNGEICNRSKSGKIYWVQTTVVPFMNAKGKPESYIGIRTDITESKMNALELSETRDILSFQINQLQEANADLDQFAYVASHDLKSPLNGISQLVSWLDEDCRDLLPEESKEHLTLLKSRSKRMLNLLNDLLEYSRIGRDEHAKETLNLKEVSTELFELQGNRENFVCNGQDVDFKLQRIPFEMVLRNLISNAIKHHDKKQGHIDISYELIKDSGTEKHQFKITDDGPGIPVDLQEKATEMFQTLQSRDETEGSGMGLAMVKKMAEKYEGSLVIESDGKRGTTFIVQWGV